MIWGALSAEASLPVFACATNEQAVEKLVQFLQPGDVVAVKGSRGMKTDEIVKALLDAPGNS